MMCDVKVNLFTRARVCVCHIRSQLFLVYAEEEGLQRQVSGQT